MQLDVPYYQQTADFTCGPACVLMVVKYFDPDEQVSREFEFDVWRETTTIGSWGSDPYGLSLPLLKRGLLVNVISEKEQPFPLQRIARVWGEDAAEVALFAVNQSQKKALDLGLKFEKRKPTLEDTKTAVYSGSLAIALVNMYVVHRYNIPHWVVAVGFDGDSVYVKDPYPPKGKMNLKLTYRQYERMMIGLEEKIGASRTLVSVRRR